MEHLPREMNLMMRQESGLISISNTRRPWNLACEMKCVHFWVGGQIPRPFPRVENNQSASCLESGLVISVVPPIFLVSARRCGFAPSASSVFGFGNLHPLILGRARKHVRDVFGHGGRQKRRRRCDFAPSALKRYSRNTRDLWNIFRVR